MAILSRSTNFTQDMEIKHKYDLAQIFSKNLNFEIIKLINLNLGYSKTIKFSLMFQVMQNSNMTF